MQWADPADRTDYPTGQLIYLVQLRPTPSSKAVNEQSEGIVRRGLACFPERLFGRAGIDMRCRPTPIAPELTRTTLCPAARRRTTVSTMAESVDKSGWWVVSCTIDDVPASITPVGGDSQLVNIPGVSKPHRV